MGEQRTEPLEKLALRVREAAESIGVSERHLRDVLPEIPHTRIGTCVVIPIDLFKEWLRKRASVEQRGADEVANDIMKELHSPTTRGND